MKSESIKISGSNVRSNTVLERHELRLALKKGEMDHEKGCSPLVGCATFT